MNSIIELFRDIGAFISSLPPTIKAVVFVAVIIWFVDFIISRFIRVFERIRKSIIIFCEFIMVIVMAILLLKENWMASALLLADPASPNIHHDNLKTFALSTLASIGILALLELFGKKPDKN